MKKLNVLPVKGFSILEALIVIAIMGILLAITMYSFTNMRNKKTLDIATDSITFKLEEAKANALAGKDGQNFGIYFTDTSYTYFSGNSYNSSDPNNSSTTLPTNLQITKSLSGGTNSVIFSRLTGLPDATGVITITNTNNSASTTITIGTSGDINVVK